MRTGSLIRVIHGFVFVFMFSHNIFVNGLEISEAFRYVLNVPMMMMMLMMSCAILPLLCQRVLIVVNS